MTYLRYQNKEIHSFNYCIMNKNNGCGSQLLQVSNVIATLSLLLTIVFAIIQLRKNNEAQRENNLNQEVTYTMNLLLPCWEQWKDLYYQAQVLSEPDRNFLAKVGLAEDRWMVTTMVLEIDSDSSRVSNKIKSAMKKGNFKAIPLMIDTILAKQINPAIKEADRKIRDQRNQF